LAIAVLLLCFSGQVFADSISAGEISSKEISLSLACKVAKERGLTLPALSSEERKKWTILF